MGRIRVLDTETINLVAAGEVVERPASVVKELVENAFDAGAAQVEVSVERELKAVTVADNGWGIAAEDVLLAFERHATSKISASADLGRIQTLGFRGEALPSIAAVARVQLKTRTPEALGGTLLVIEGGEVRDFRPAGAPPGTTITVRDLFYNTPARRKFLGSTRAESARLTDMVARLALGRPDVSVTLTTGGREVFRTPGAGLLGAITAVYGGSIAEALVPVEAEDEGVRVEGYVGRPALARATRSGQTLLVNGRYVKHGGLAAAVYHAFGTLLPAGKHPFFVLHLVLDPGLVDVNVHPQKMAARFAREKELTGLICAAVKRALFGRISLIPRAGTGPKTGGAAAPQGDWAGALRRLGSPEEGHFSLPAAGRTPGIGDNARVLGGGFPAESKDELFFREETPRYNEQAGFPRLEYLAFLPPVYLLASGPEGLFLIDQHAAHERVLFEEYSAAAARGGIMSQFLMEPEPLEMATADLTDAAAELVRYGFLIEPFGECAALLRAIPAGVGPDSARLLIADFLASLANNDLPGTQREERWAASMACHSAVKAGEVLSPAEAVALIARLAACREPFTCPHGRPTVVCLSHEELLRRFGRRNT
ncbi:MAG: DNA mismatch repair endonuclease MutL [Bacillota bacterium]